MKISYFFSAFLLFSAINVCAQTKINYALAKKKQSASNEIIDVLVQGDLNTIKHLTENHQGRFKYAAGDIASIRIPVSSLSYFISDKLIKRIEAYE
jgi:hypothetical protein